MVAENSKNRDGVCLGGSHSWGGALESPRAFWEMQPRPWPWTLTGS
jgi:hypothetical protein